MPSSIQWWRVLLIGERGVHHLVGHHPVVLELLGSGVLADPHPRPRAAIRPGRPGEHAGAAGDQAR